MSMVVSEAGKSFDPRVVEILARRYVELEKLANEQPLQAPPKLSTDVKVKRGLAPDAGFAAAEATPVRSAEANQDAGGLVAAARREVETLTQLALKLGGSLGLEDTISLLAVRVKRLVPHDSMAVFVVRNKTLVPEFVSGDNSRLFSALRIPLGEGLSGWVAQNAKIILNGNPAVEPGYRSDAGKHSTLRSALAVPLEGGSGVVAVLALYRTEQDAFGADDLNVVQAMASGLGVAIESSLGRGAAGSVLRPSTAAARAGAD
jgi:GAF domain-containing protein